MPRRTATPATPAPSAPLPPPPRDLTDLAQHDPLWAANLAILRRHWKWANFSQFFYTFAPLLAMPDVFLSDVEDDLARGTNLYLPRIMHRLLYTLSQDRKLNIDNWQTALRRQYLRRDPAANPIGPEPKVPSRESSVSPSEDDQEEAKEDVPDPQSHPADASMDTDHVQDEAQCTTETATKDEDVESRPETKAEVEEEDAKVPKKESDDQHVQSPKAEEEEESKDWLELPMMEKLDSLHLVIEWQFQNPYRLRQLMKDDDDGANWRIEPIGYDAKTNAYWLIGPDRLWIQRVPPKPPRSRNLKRKRPAATPKKRAKVSEPSSDEEDEEPVTRSKRSRTQSQSKSSASRSRTQPQTNGRATRTSRRAGRSSGPETEVISAGKSTRAAKVQANKKLDLQAKELAEFQRQTAALQRSSPRKSARAPTSPAKRALGTRVSARLRHAGKAEDDDSDDEWQQVPDEWLQESASPSRRTRARTRRSRGKARQESEDDEAEGSGDDARESEPDVEKGQDDEAGGAVEDEDQEKADEEEQKDGEGEGLDGREADGVVEDDSALLQKAGLESGSDSDLTDLSDQEEPEAAEVEVSKPRRRGARKAAVGVRRSSRRNRQSNAKQQQPPSAKEVVQQLEEEQDIEPSAPLPPDFVEWEAIAITLVEWEHVADPFEKATHYLEKALYKMLTQNVIPIVTADLREAEKRRRMEEAVVHRKRSSRIAIKESEKEEARVAAKKKAEEEDKLARSRRQEARRKKEDTERAKRERARDERAKERDAREARARAKAERQAREEAAAARSTATPSVNGTGPSSSVLPSRVVTPNGVRTPDWILDCEVCHKQGVNVDDGLPMVSCGSCNRWQHIACHDLIDQRAGRPRRDWEKQQFFCGRCRQRAINGGSFGGHGVQGYAAHQQQYAWQGARGSIHLQKPGDAYSQSDPRYGHRSPVENGMGYSQQQYASNSSPQVPYARSYPNAGMSFNHYQPDQRGLSRAAPVTSQGSWSSSSNGYGAAAEQIPGSMQSSHFTPQYPPNGSVYASGRLPSAYSNHPPSSNLSQFNGLHNPVGTMSGSRWQASTSNGYHGTNHHAVQEAAQSLAFMHDGNGRYSSNGSGWPSQSSSYGQHSPASSQAHHSYPHIQAPPTNIDPLTGQPFR